MSSRSHSCFTDDLTLQMQALICTILKEGMSKKTIQGPVVQSIVSLTSSLRGQSLSVLRLYNRIH